MSFVLEDIHLIRFTLLQSLWLLLAAINCICLQWFGIRKGKLKYFLALLEARRWKLFLPSETWKAAIKMLCMCFNKRLLNVAVCSFRIDCISWWSMWMEVIWCIVFSRKANSKNRWQCKSYYSHLVRYVSFTTLLCTVLHSKPVLICGHSYKSFTLRYLIKLFIQ